jgi:DMSO/TMAO reductase YedYZ molybdopterin-dependent catalytic subunit
LQLSISAAARALLRSRADGAALQADCTLQLHQLGAMPQHDVVAVLECAGNRRREMARPERGESSEGIQWGAGAVGNVAWRGELCFAGAQLALHPVRRSEADKG